MFAKWREVATTDELPLSDDDLSYIKVYQTTSADHDTSRNTKTAEIFPDDPGPDLREVNVRGSDRT
jgi:hypothetical protein